MNNFERAAVLSEALPYIRAYGKKTVVVNYDTNAMHSKELVKTAISDIVLLSLIGLRVIVVHDGDPSAERVGKDIVSMIAKEGGKAFSFSGLDASLFTAKKPQGEGGKNAPCEIAEINPELVTLALDNGYIPIISALARCADCNEICNISAPVAAMELAVNLGAEKLIALTNSAAPQNNDGSAMSVLPLSKVRAFIKEGIISGEMLHIVDSCVKAVRKGVPRAHILDGRLSHSILIEMLTDSGVGTMILYD